MVHERDDEYEGQEDGEYHFSDDQANYEMEPEITTKTAAPSAPKPAPISSGTPSKNLRRPVIGVIVFVLVIFLVYKIISPSTNAPATEFSQNNNAGAKSMTTRQPVEKTTVVTTTTTVPARAAAPTPPPVTTVTTVTPPVTAQQQPQQVLQPGMSTTVTTTQPAMQQQYAQPSMQQGQAPEMSSAQASSAIDKLIQLQDQNTKLITQYQTESAQKIAEYETQNSELQGKLQDMALRLNSLETTITHLTKALQDTRGGSAMNNNPGAVAPSANGGRADMPDNGQTVVMARPMPMPKSAYSVQAIIPGRAWLKSDNGETVTVAEGDILKNYGKIIKIDPYDGVVQIDAGGRTVTLSYGATTE